MDKDITINLGLNINQSLYGVIEILDLLTGKCKLIPMHSVIRNFVAWYNYNFFVQQGLANINISPTISNGTQVNNSYALTNSEYIHGNIILGKGSNNKSLTMYALNQILTTSLVSYQTFVASLLTTTTLRVITYSKRFNNISAGNIAVTLIGLAARVSTSTYILLVYDYLDTPFVMLSGKSYMFRIKLSFDFSFGSIVTGRLMRQCGQSSVATYRDITNNLRAINYGSSTFCLIETDFDGIQIGSGGSANTSTMYNLETLIPKSTMHFDRSILSISNVFVLDGIYAIKDFLNVSASLVIIRLVAWVTGGIQDSSLIKRSFLSYRYVLDSPITVQSGLVVVVKMLFKVNYA